MNSTCSSLAAVDTNWAGTRASNYVRIGLIRHTVGWLTTLGLILASSSAVAQSVEEFYRGKTISIIVPADPGGAYDLHTRMVARHIRKFILGTPNIIVQNMQGAGGLRAINYLYEKAPADGTVIGMPVQENVIADVFGGTEVGYKNTRLQLDWAYCSGS